VAPGAAADRREGAGLIQRRLPRPADGPGLTGDLGDESIRKLS
jgi:hypothetical protein